MNRLRCGIGDRLNDHVALSITMNIKVEKVSIACLRDGGDLGIGSFADLTFQAFPNVGINEGGLLHMLLAFEPLSKAVLVDVLH